MYKVIPGTKDILPEEVSRWQEIEDISRKIFSVYNYRQIRPPLIEEAALFNRSLGEFTEIVQKQMFLIRNKEDLYVLRPEGTASVVRAYIENSLDVKNGFVKLYYIGPMFRLERPQKGRLRQFHHIGCEVIGSEEADLDIEIISLADSLLKAYSIKGYKIKLNSLGCVEDKKKLSGILHDELPGRKSELCEDCNVRLKQNILRILDCKNQSCRNVVNGLNIQDRYLCRECKEHFTRVRKGLDELSVEYEISGHLVRGLDYYTRTVFAITHQDLGAQDALGAGGRYDNLVGDLGGPQTGAIGFAFGIERLLLVQSQREETDNRNLVYLITLGDEAKFYGAKLLNNLRRNNISSDTDYEGKSLKGAMRRANDLGARYVLILGDDELKENTITLKDMLSGEQRKIRCEKLEEEITLKK